MNTLRVIWCSIYVLSRGVSKLFCKWLLGIDSFFVENGLRGLVRFSKFSRDVSLLWLSVTQCGRHGGHIGPYDREGGQ